MNRRQFLHRSATLASAVAAAGIAGAGCASSAPRDHTAAATSRPAGANDDIRIAVIGMHKQGKVHINAFSKTPGVRIVALCDCDEQVLNENADALAKNTGREIARYRDLRKLLERKDLDAVSMALPVRWHSLAAIWACQAGKHVYVEKPVSHCIWEGRKLVEAARKHRRLVQAGLNNRSRPELEEIFSYIGSGAIGRIDHVRAWDYKRRQSIGKVAGPQRIPDSVDYDLWTGPGPMLPLMRKEFHYDWHWQWPIGMGEIGNNGVHHLDLVRWALDKPNHLPQRVLSFGGRYGYIDDGDTPNTHVAVYDYDGIPVVYECRGLPEAKSSEKMDDLLGTTADGKPIRLDGKPGAFGGFAVVCEGGYCVDSTVYDNSGKIINRLPRRPVRPQAAFIDALRSGRREDLRPEILQGHLSTAMCHMGNIAVQCGEAMTFAHAKQRLADDRHATAALERMTRHLSANAVDVAAASVTVGPTLTMDSRTERFIGEGSDRANWFVKDSYRAPFVVPERV